MATYESPASTHDDTCIDMCNGGILPIAACETAALALQAFDGTLFFFSGTPGHIYNLASDAGQFQVC
jgi:hypothetical protein